MKPIINLESEKKMKKALMIFLSLVIALTLAAYGGLFDSIIDKIKTEKSEQITEQTPENESEHIEDTTGKYAGVYTGADVIYKENGITIINRGFDSVGGTHGPALKLYIINESDREYLVQVREFKVNGEYITPILSTYIYPGESDLADLILLRSDLREHKISLVETIEFTFIFLDSHDLDNPIESQTITINME